MWTGKFKYQPTNLNGQCNFSVRIITAAAYNYENHSEPRFRATSPTFDVSNVYLVQQYYNNDDTKQYQI